MEGFLCGWPRTKASEITCNNDEAGDSGSKRYLCGYKGYIGWLAADPLTAP